MWLAWNTCNYKRSTLPLPSDEGLEFHDSVWHVFWNPNDCVIISVHWRYSEIVKPLKMHVSSDISFHFFISHLSLPRCYPTISILCHSSLWSLLSYYEPIFIPSVPSCCSRRVVLVVASHPRWRWHRHRVCRWLTATWLPIPSIHASHLWVCVWGFFSGPPSQHS